MDEDVDMLIDLLIALAVVVKLVVKMLIDTNNPPILSLCLPRALSLSLSLSLLCTLSLSLHRCMDEDGAMLVDTNTSFSSVSQTPD